MKKIIFDINQYLLYNNIIFYSKPIIIGDNALFFYGIKKERGFTELIARDEDFELLSKNSQYKLKDSWGDLGIELGKIDVWRSFSLFDYDFYLKGAMESEYFFVISLDQLIFTKILKFDDKKNLDDLLAIKDYYFKSFRNSDYVINALSSYSKYKESPNGLIYL